MPVKSEKQRRFMYASLAGKTDVPPSVAKKFVGPSAHKADGGSVKESEMKKMMNGGMAAPRMPAPRPGPSPIINEAKLRNATASAAELIRNRGRGLGTPTVPDMPSRGFGGQGRTPPTTMPIRPPAMKKGGKATAYAKGGGIESKGKTKGKMVKMMGGGKC